MAHGLPVFLIMRLLLEVQNALRGVQGAFPGRKHFALLLLWLFTGLCLPLLVFAELAEEVWERDSFSWDEPILLFMQENATPARDIFFVFFTELGRSQVMVPLCLFIGLCLLLRRLPLQAIFWLVATLGAMLLPLPGKALFGRPRPDLWMPLIPEPTLSFPSGHATTAMAVASALMILAWPTKWRWLSVAGGAAFTLCVGLSRIYLGVHYPSDVVAGWCVGTIWVVGVQTILHVQERQYINRARQYMLRLAQERQTQSHHIENAS